MGSDATWRGGDNVNPHGSPEPPSRPVAASASRWLVLLVIGACAVIGLGIWQLSIGQSRTGFTLIAIALLDCAWVGYLYYRRSTQG
jgi:hypothetical protein